MNKEILQKLLELNDAKISTEEYHELWKELGPLEIKLVDKIGKCKHELNDVFYYKTPYEKPNNVCTALLHVLDLYIWRVALNFPSWETDDCRIHRIHCPAKKGTIWELKKK